MLGKSLKLLLADGDTNKDTNNPAFPLFCALSSEQLGTDLQASVHLEKVMFATRLTRLLLADVAFSPLSFSQMLDEDFTSLLPNRKPPRVLVTAQILF